MQPRRVSQASWLRLSLGLGRFRAGQFPIVPLVPSSSAVGTFASLSDLEGSFLLAIREFVLLVKRVSGLTGPVFLRRLGGPRGPVLRPPECSQLLGRPGQYTHTV